MNFQLKNYYVFPEPDDEDDNGFIHIGNSYNAEELVSGYMQGAFPWYDWYGALVWFSPKERMILYPEDFHLQRKVRKLMEHQHVEMRMDSAFDDVLHACATVKRKHQDGTWISDEIKEAYHDLHELGIAHSFETWYEGELVGGIYGLQVGKFFGGESMFHKRKDASKAALAHLVAHAKAEGLRFIDCQLASEHMRFMGAVTMPRLEFLKLLAEVVEVPPDAERVPSYGVNGADMDMFIAKFNAIEAKKTS